MKKTLTPGVSGQWQHRVVTENLVSHRRPGAPPVLSTPWLLHLMERAAYEAILPHLDAGETSVGHGFDFKHLAPTPAGETIVTTARVTAVDGKMVHLDFEARDSQGLVAEGRHIRAIINVERFNQRLRKRKG
jgi:fluoroacetyl-CoA thioesterase